MSPKSRPKRPIDIYCRVSRVGGRDVQAEGGTAAEQERRCRAQLEADGLEAGEVFVDLDESGGKESRPAFDKLMRRALDGTSGGIIVLNLKRFGRRRSVVEDILRLEEHGAAFLSCEEKIDTSTPSGRFMLSVFAALAAMELEERTEGWERARQNAVSRGIHVTATTPAGYDRDPETRLLVPNDEAETVRKAFEARAKGATLTETARILTEGGVRTSHAGRVSKVTGEVNDGTLWSARGTRILLSNRVYLGEARSGDYVRRDAHPAIVTPALFARVQARLKQPGDYSAKREKHPLAGLVRCASCGYAMKRDSTTRRGQVYHFWRCNAKERCTARASLGADLLESYIDTMFIKAAQSGEVSYVLGGHAPTSDDAALEAELLEAEEELRLYVETTSVAGIGAELFRDGLALRQQRVDAARKAIAEVATPPAFEIPPGLEDEMKIVRDGFGLELRGEALAELWRQHMPAAAKRIVYQRVFEKIEVSKGRGPVEQRVTVVLSEA